MIFNFDKFIFFVLRLVVYSGRYCCVLDDSEVKYLLLYNIRLIN